VRSTTGSHSPFTDAESRTWLARTTVRASTTSRPSPAAVTSPRSSTIPVNTRHHLQIRADPLDPFERQSERRAHRNEALTPDHARPVFAADHLRRNVEHDPVHDTALDERPREPRAALDERPLDVALAEGIEQPGDPPRPRAGP